MKVKRFMVLLVFAVLLSCAGVASSQEDGSKGIKAEIFIGNRPLKSATRRPPAARKKPTYKSAQVMSSAAPPPGKEFAQVGVTIWRFRPATSADKTKELVEEVDAPPTEWSLERISEGTLLAPGQRIRLGIESLSRDGYLYVIDREEYADGSFGDAHLIFPSRRTPEGGNRVKAGKVIYIPAKSFRIKPSDTSKGHVAEVLTLLVSPKPLIDTAEFAGGPWVIAPERLAAWEKQWAVSPTKFEMEGGEGQPLSEQEQLAAQGQSVLTQDEPVPQTIYRLAVKPADTLLVTVPLRFTSTKAGKN